MFEHLIKSDQKLRSMEADERRQWCLAHRQHHLEEFGYKANDQYPDISKQLVSLQSEINQMCEKGDYSSHRWEDFVANLPLIVPPKSPT